MLMNQADIERGKQLPLQILSHWIFFFLLSLPTSQKGPLRRRGAWPGKVATQSLPNELKFDATPSKKDDLSEMPGFLLGGLTVLICGEASMLSASIRKMFHLCMFADFTWRNGSETL